MDTPSLTIAILSGGAASRLGGRDKGLALFRERALVDHVLEAARAMHAGPAHVLIVANRHFDEYARRARTLADDVPAIAARSQASRRRWAPAPRHGC